MVEIVSLLIGLAVIPLIAVVVLAGLGLYLSGFTSATESVQYVNTADVERYRREHVRDEEADNTEASVVNERPPIVPGDGE